MQITKYMREAPIRRLDRLEKRVSELEAQHKGDSFGLDYEAGEKAVNDMIDACRQKIRGDK